MANVILLGAFLGKDLVRSKHIWHIVNWYKYQFPLVSPCSFLTYPIRGLVYDCGPERPLLHAQSAF
jgi:hypothetical protein